MQELRFVAVSEDGSYAVLAVPGRSARFVLPIDERLRAVALGQTSRLAQYEIEVESPLRPKEIQARIRAGETVEEIADAAGIAVERVRWFEGPVLAERAYVADQAQAASVRRQGDSSPGPRLGEIVAERLAAVGTEPDEAQWDSRKRGDGSWLVQLTFPSGGRLHVAEWVFDPRRRHVMPADDSAARLSLPDSELPPPAVSAPGEATVTQLAPRLGAAASGGGAAARFRPDRVAQAAPVLQPPAPAIPYAAPQQAVSPAETGYAMPPTGGGSGFDFEPVPAARPAVPDPVRDAAAREAAEAAAREAEAREQAAREAAAREQAAREAEAREAAEREAAAREAAAREAAAREAAAREAAAREAAAREAAAREAAEREAAEREAAAQEAAERRAAEQAAREAADAEAREAASREAAAREAAEREAAAREAAEAEAREAAEPQGAERQAAGPESAGREGTGSEGIGSEDAAHETPAHEPAAHETPARKAAGHKAPARKAAAHQAPAHKAPAHEADPHEAGAHEDPAHEAGAQKQAPEPATTAKGRPGKKTGPRGRRSSVPSWDEIMLGSSRQRD